jgi:hypothetical protein
MVLKSYCLIRLKIETNTYKRNSNSASTGYDMVRLPFTMTVHVGANKGGRGAQKLISLERRALLLKTNLELSSRAETSDNYQEV